MLTSSHRAQKRIISANMLKSIYNFRFHIRDHCSKWVNPHIGLVFEDQFPWGNNGVSEVDVQLPPSRNGTVDT